MTSRWSASRFAAATAALQAVMSFASPADVALSQFFRAQRQLGVRDRALIADTVYDILRHLRWLQQLCGSLLPRHLLLTALIKLDGQPLAMVEAFAKPDEMLWLTQAKSNKRSDQEISVRVDLPDWMFTRLERRFSPEEIESLGRSLQAPAPLDLRVNTLKITRAQAIERFHNDGMQCEPTSLSPVGLRMAGKPSINLHPLFQDGSVEVQDEGSQLLAYLLAPRRQDIVVDFCAGAGGKTLALGAIMHSQGRIYAFDISDKRLSQFSPRLRRSGLSNVFPQRITGVRDRHVKRLAKKVDRVLVDAPCSGTGTLRRNPDLKWRQSEADIDQMSAKQSEILSAAAGLVKPKGRLVYATCSLLDDENDAVVNAFLATHPDFSVLDASTVLAQNQIPLATGNMLRLRPDLHHTDGFFAAVLQRE